MQVTQLCASVCSLVDTGRGRHAVDCIVPPPPLSPNSYVEAPLPSVMVFGDRTSSKLGLDEVMRLGVLMMGLVP